MVSSDKRELRIILGVVLETAGVGTLVRGSVLAAFWSTSEDHGSGTRGGWGWREGSLDLGFLVDLNM